MADFEERFAEGKGIGDHIIDQINFQISFYGELHTEAAKQIGKPLVEFMKAYVVQLDCEVQGCANVKGQSVLPDETTVLRDMLCSIE